jgi:Fe-S cluster assembly protein SufA/iron-sulfur cluster assembly protein
MNDFTMLLTPSAEQYLSKKISQGKAIQIRLKHSGCSGYSYVLNIVDQSPDNIYLRSLPFDIIDKDKDALNNVLIDVKKEGLNSKVVFENPQAFNHCGCGESFSIRK